MIPQYAFSLKFTNNEIVNSNWKKTFPGDLFFIKNYDNPDEWREIVSDSFLQLSEKILPLCRIMIFNKPRVWSITDAHIDPGVLFALNVIFDDSGARMQWFQPIVPDQKSVSYTAANTTYFNYHDNEIKLVHEECLADSVWIVRTDVPHRIKIGSTPRTCISLRFKTKPMNWDQVYLFFRELDWL